MGLKENEKEKKVGNPYGFIASSVPKSMTWMTWRGEIGSGRIVNMKRRRGKRE